MSKITFGYIVGGEDKHYNNLLRSLESLERIEQPHEVVILDADSRLEADEDKPNVRIIPFPVDEEKGEGWFKPHYWQMRYHLNKYVETDHCFYMDTDTVIVNDRVDELIEEAGEDFLICRHWWVPQLQDYLQRVRIIPFPVDEAKGEGWFKPHYWQMRYHLNKYIETDHCFYMDTDTAVSYTHRRCRRN